MNYLGDGSLLKTIFNGVSSLKYKLRNRSPNLRSLFMKNIFIDEQLSLILRDLVSKYYIEGNNIQGTVISVYNIRDCIEIIIKRNNEKLYYIVNEPMIDSDSIEVIEVLYRENVYSKCKSMECISRVLESKDIGLVNKFFKNPMAIMYHYSKLESGYGPLYPLVIDEKIEEIGCNQDDKKVFIIHREYMWYGWMETNIVLDKEIIDNLVLALARKTGQHISLAHPIAEGLTKEGIRVALTYSNEVSRKGSSFVLRKKQGTPWTITRLIDQGVLSPQIATYLWLILELRGSIMIVGSMSTGKTTLLQALLTLIPPTKRVITIEDTPEITATTGLWDPLVIRPNPNTQLYIDEYKLLKFALRRRADYIIVGEVRGREARLLIQASRLGHGVLATMHADDAQAAIERLSSPPISIPRNLLDSIWTIVVMDPGGSSGFRRVKDVYEIVHGARSLRKIAWFKNGSFEPNSIEALINNSIRLPSSLDQETAIDELSNRTIFLSQLVSNGVFDINDLSNELHRFYSVTLEEISEAIMNADRGH